MSDGCVAMHPAERRAARARIALVARRGAVLEVQAARALQQVAARGGEVAQLAGRPGDQRLRQRRVALAHQRVRRQVGVAHRRAEAQPAAVQLLHLAERQPRDVDQQRGRGDPELHVVDEVGAAGQIRGVRALRDERDGARGVVRALEVEGPHRAACSIAATMFT
jgi:hypothetical protein